MITFWRVFGLVYTVGVALVVRDKYREREAARNKKPDSIEDQLDSMIHASEINERNARFVTKPGDVLPTLVIGKE